ncbi:TonB-dependent receptor [Sphingobacterium kyonggiense]
MKMIQVKLSASSKFWSLWMLIFLCARLQGQETSGSISGKITNQNLEAIQSATIEAIHLPTNTKYSTATDKSGRYYFDNIRLGGPYHIKANMQGMKEELRSDIIVRLGGSEQVNFILTSLSLALEEIVVKGRGQGQVVDQYGIGKYISAEELKNLPTISRSITDMTRLTAQGSRDNSFAGSNFRYNNVTIDGAVNNDAIGFSPSLGGQTGTSGMIGSSTRTNPISLDAIQDIQVYLAPYDVKIGNFTGGSINAVTRSGSNTFSGSFYAYGRNASLVAADRVGSLGKIDGNFQDYQAGFRLGFPIIKDKLYFFSNEEIVRRRDPSQLVAGSMETAHILNLDDAEAIKNTVINRYGNIFDAGTADNFTNWSNSMKFFNRLDWNISSSHQLAIRNNTISSKASHMDRDQQDFRFSSMAFEQQNFQTSTVAELKSRYSNNLSSNAIVGFTLVNDKRNPLSNPSLPQVQIQGRTPGTTIYLGTDREASIFDMKQRTWEISYNLKWNKGIHKLLFGTHNELYQIQYGFVNAWNGRVDYNNISDFLNNNPYRVRGTYNYVNNSRAYNQNNPAANFNVNMYSLYAQDEIRVNNDLSITPGLRLDFTHLPQKPLLSDKIKNIVPDPNFGNTYSYTPISRLENDYFNKVSFSPRLGFKWNILPNERLIIRGGAGLFTGRIPLAWIAYAYYNTGNSYGAFDQRADAKAFATGTDAIKPSEDGIAEFIKNNGAVLNDPNSGKTQVDLIDNGFTMPQVFRNSLAIDFKTEQDWKFSFEGIYTKNLNDILFQQVNNRDYTLWYGNDSNKQQPFYSGTVDSRFSNVYLLSQTKQGYRYNLTGTISKTWKNLFRGSFSYTYGQARDLSNGVRNSMESNWQLNQSLIPNNPSLAVSNFDIPHRIVSNLSYNVFWKNSNRTNISLFFQAQSGAPFSYGIVNYSVQGLPQQVSLVYIPHRSEAVHYFRDIQGGQSANDQARAFNEFIDANSYLTGRRGQFTERNKARTPWNYQADLQIAHDIYFNKSSSRNFTISLDVMNLTNLIHSNWGIQYFSPNTFNSTSSIGLTPTLFPNKQNKDAWPVYTFQNPGKPYSIDYFNSRAQMQLGVRYSF